MLEFTALVAYGAAIGLYASGVRVNTLLASFLTWYRRLACPYFFLLEEQARRLYHTLLIKNARVPTFKFLYVRGNFKIASYELID